jgi:hypothetical protein
MSKKPKSKKPKRSKEPKPAPLNSAVSAATEAAVPMPAPEDTEEALDEQLAVERKRGGVLGGSRAIRC